jgi:outer membrane immunogenic protein
VAVKAPAVAPVSSWSGIYLGISGGSGWGNNEYSWNQDATVVAIAAQTNGNDGFPLLGGTKGSHPISGEFFGGQLGVNWQAGWVVLGLQADAHWADIKGSGSCSETGVFSTVGLSFACDDKISSFGTITARVGATVDHALIYAKGGWAWEHGHNAVNPTIPATFINQNNNAGAFGTSITGGSSTHSQTGWTLGAGIEYAITPNWSAFVEYDYFDFGTRGVNYLFVLNQNPGETPATINIPMQATASDKFSAVRVGVNHKFNWWGTAVAGY